VKNETKVDKRMKKIFTCLLFIISINAAQSAHADNKTLKFRLGGIQSKIETNFTKIEQKEIIKRTPLNQNNVGDSDFYEIMRDKNNVAFIYDDGSGVVEENYNYSASYKTPFFVYSISKSFTGMMLLHSICQNDIKSLDKKMGDVSQRLKSTIYENVTIRNALKMQSGVGENFFKKLQIPMFLSFLNKEKTPIDWINEISDKYDQGQKFLYNANDANALGIVLEDITGRNMQEIEIILARMV